MGIIYIPDNTPYTAVYVSYARNETVKNKNNYDDASKGFILLGGNRRKIY